MSAKHSIALEVLGPRVSGEELRRHPVRYALPTFCLTAAAILLLISIFLPYWGLTLYAPQYPGGLRVEAYLNQLTGDVQEIDGLNHYIGMRPLGEAAQLERSLSLLVVGVLALLVVSAVFIHTRWAALLSLPTIVFPAAFLGDLQFWLYNFGQNLDPRAPLSGAVEPFVPPVLGEGKVGQFRTVSSVEEGFLLASAAAILVVVGLAFHYRAYAPLVERLRRKKR